MTISIYFLLIDTRIKSPLCIVKYLKEELDLAEDNDFDMFDMNEQNRCLCLHFMKIVCLNLVLLRIENEGTSWFSYDSHQPRTSSALLYARTKLHGAT